MTLIADRYERIEKLGQGGMGEVYRGLDTRTQLPVAIKHLRGTVSHDPEVLERFQREGVALRNLNHPNIVKMLDMVQHEDDYYLIMEYIDGGDLAELLKARGSLAVEEVIRMGLEIADALARAHHLGIIHRDIKPANVLIAHDGTPRLTDFGVARVESQERLTGTGMAVGTLDYMPPEAVNGEAVDARADIWALGVMLYEMLTGERPFAGATTLELLTTILTKPVPDIARRRPDIPLALADLIHHMLDKDREKRLRSVRQAGAALEAILQGEPVNPQHETPPRSPTTRSIAAETEPLGDMPLTPTPTSITKSQRSWLWLLPVALVLVIAIGGAGLAASGLLTPPNPTAIPTATGVPTALPTLVPTVMSANAPAPDGFQWVSVDEARFLVPIGYVYIGSSEIVKVLGPSIEASELNTAMDTIITYFDQMRSAAMYINWLKLQSVGVLIEDTGMVLSIDEQIRRNLDLTESAGLEFSREPEIVDLPVGQAVRFDFQTSMNATEIYVTFFSYQRGGTQYIILFNGRVDNAAALESTIATVTNSFYIADDVEVTPEATAAITEDTASNWKEVTGDGFTIEMPDKWIALPASNELMQSFLGELLPEATSQEQMRALVNQFDVQLLFGDISAETAVALATMNAEEQLSVEFVESFIATVSADLNFDMAEPETIQLSAGSARRIRLRLPAYEDKAAYEMTIYLMDTANGFYGLTFVAPATLTDESAPLYEQIAQSFAVVPPADQAADWKTVTGEGFTLELPKTWLALPATEELLQSSMSLFLPDDPAQEKMELILDQFDVRLLFGQFTGAETAGAVMRLDTSGQPVSADFIETLLTTISADLDAEVRTTENVTLPGGTARHMRMYLPTTGDKIAYEIGIYLLDTPNGFYMVSFIAPDARFAELAPLYEQIAQSFSVTPDALIPTDWKVVTEAHFSLAMPQTWLVTPATATVMRSGMAIFIPDEADLNELLLFFDQFEAQVLFGQFVGDETAGAVFTIGSEYAVDVPFLETLLASITTKLGYTLHEPEIITLPSGTARRSRLSLPATGDKPAFEFTLYMIDTPHGFYMLSFNTGASRYDELLPMYEQIMQTFTTMP